MRREHIHFPFSIFRLRFLIAQHEWRFTDK